MVVVVVPVWREDGRERTDVAAAEFGAEGSHGCAQSARAQSVLQSYAPVAFRMLPSLEVYCLGTNTCFFCYLK